MQTVKEFAEKLNISVARVHQLIEDGRITCKRFGHMMVIPANQKDPRKAVGRPKIK